MKTKPYFHFLLVLLCWGQPLLPAASGRVAAASVTSFTLVNADTDLDLVTLTPGMVVDLSVLPTQNLNIRANTGPGPVGSVTFDLSGTQIWSATETVPPYAVFSDFLGDYFGWTPAVGSYTLLATPFDGPAGTGLPGTPLTISFSVVIVLRSVTSFTLVNADTELDILPLTEGLSLNINALPALSLNVRATTNPPTVGSVVFSLSGAQTWSNTENVPPYAAFSDFLGDYFGWTPTPGTYTLTAVPYDSANGTGTAGTPLALAFTLVDVPLPVQLSAFNANALPDGSVQLRWQTASEINNREFEVQRSPDGRQFGALGRVPGHGRTSAPHAYAFSDPERLASGAKRYYRLRQLDFDGTAHYSPVRAVTGQGARPVLRLYSPVSPATAVQYAFSGRLTGAESMGLYNLMGQRIGYYPVDAAGAGAVPVAGLSAGTYVLQLLTSESRFTGRFVLP